MFIIECASKEFVQWRNTFRFLSMYYKDIVTCISGVRRGFVSMSRFIGSSPGRTAINYNTSNLMWLNTPWLRTIKVTATTPHKLNTSLLTSVSDAFVWAELCCMLFSADFCVWVLCYDRRTVGRLSWNKSPIWVLRPDLYYYQKLAGLLMWGFLSDEKMGLSCAIVAGPRQRCHSRVRAPWDSGPYFTVSDSRLHFSSPPTTSRATAEVFHPASTREGSVRVTLRLAVYRQTVRLGDKPLETHDQ
jgi:hypothetical protein